ncbi:pectinacetylesterase family protein [Myxococcota bacterium]|nr:pectinacetylesterase family protein [Myxococcota bacterium]
MKRALTLCSVALVLASACASSDEQIDGSVPLDAAQADGGGDAALDAAGGDDADVSDADVSADGGVSDAEASADAEVRDADLPDASEAPDSGPIDAGPPPIGTPITTTPGQWEWVDFPDAFCDDGTTTGIGVNTSTTSSNVLIFMNGGGACWDQLTCIFLNTAAHGPFGAAQFAQLASGIGVGPFRRDDPENPFRDWSWVFVPYCTGDVHGGQNVVNYGSTAPMYHHTGHANMLAYLARLAPTFPAPAKLVLSGSSAGGFGASFNYPAVRSYWTTGQVYLLDDSGPALSGSYIPAGFRSAWYTQWRIDLILDPLCGAACQTDLSAAYTAMSLAYPNDRFALLSSMQDEVIRNYFAQSPANFEMGLRALAQDVLDPLPNFAYFFVPGSSHTMLGNPEDFTSNGTPLKTWLRQLVTDDPAWTSTSP